MYKNKNTFVFQIFYDIETYFGKLHLGNGNNLVKHALII